MSKVEIISLIVSIIALVSLCAVFTIFLINFCKKSISDIKLGRQDEDIIISEMRYHIDYLILPWFLIVNH